MDRFYNDLYEKCSVIILVMLLGISACKTSYKYPRFDFDNGPNPCINAFKDRMFLSILREAYKGTNAIKEISKIDVGNPYDGISSPELFKKIDSIAVGFYKKIPPPSVCDECTEEQNYFMAQALHFYASKELDSIARTELKEIFFRLF
ncbi:hypothetical protein [Pedobacter sp. Leaf176]|uniref:hypothetical protein n=1 Tax=Pedobacter sp. Leaf176 TaxID=1736286 RepID=UPI0006F48D39|nr:hypothetical protein [Pedobacter sp. Leaf176]KQR65354.1 hypothetical protein ASF92_20710 [Pedobacter sp. Leaf176]